MLQKIPESIGQALHDQRAGLEHTVLERLKKSCKLALIEVSSSVFAVDNTVPTKYTADGGGVSPPLEWRNLPSATSFVAVIVEDADSPTPHPLVHAIVVNLDPRESSLVEGALDSPDHSGVGLPTGPNSFLSHAWLPPDPPPGHGPHRYVFQVFALSGPLFGKAPGREELVRAIAEFGIGAGRVIAIYERAQRVKNEDHVKNEECEFENSQPLGPDIAPA
jgi:Raf kinase inhibitor-like YbhB/YbcL family protein